MSDPTPSATGALQTTPLLQLLVYALDRRLDGTLVFEAPGAQRSALALSEGVPVKAKIAEPVLHLGRLLLEQGAIDDATLNSTLAQLAKSQRLHGELLVAQGKVDRILLQQALTEQVARKVLWMFELPPETRFGFYEGVNFLQRWGGNPTPVDALALIWRAVRGAAPAHIAPTLASLAGAELKLSMDTPLARFRLVQKEQALIELMRAQPHSLDALLATGLADALTTQRLVFGLALTRSLDLGAPGVLPVGVDEPISRRSAELLASPVSHRGSMASAPGIVSTPSPSAARDVPADTEAMERELAVRLVDLDTRTYYDVLGVPREADVNAIQAAFFLFAKRWHPDRITGDLAHLREDATRLFARVNEAHATLSNQTLRHAYDGKLGTTDKASEEEQEQVHRVLRGSMAFQRAEVLVKKRMFEAAEAEALKATQDDPSQADYAALYGWLQAQHPERAKTGSYADVLAVLDKSVAAEPDNHRIRFWRAQVLQKAGRHEDAIEDYRRVAHKDRRNVDAAREIRLYEMRQANRSGDRPAPAAKAGEGGGGFLGKLFKR